MEIKHWKFAISASEIVRSLERGVVIDSREEGIYINIQDNE
jgi:hypothetical protein